MRKILWFLVCIIYFSYITFLIVTLIIHLPRYTEKAQNYIFLSLHSLWIVAFFSGIVSGGPLLVFMKDILLLANGTEDLIIHFEKFHFGPGAFRKSSKLREKIIGGLCLEFFQAIGFCLIPLLIMFQGEVWLLQTYVSEVVLILMPRWNIFSLIIGMGVDILVMVVMCGTGYFSIHVNMLFMQTFKTGVECILRSRRVTKIRQKFLDGQQSGLRISKGKLDISTTALRRDLLNYSKLRLLTTLYNATYGRTYIPMLLTLLATMIIFGVFLTIRLSRGDPIILMLGLTLWIMCSGIMIMLTSFMAMVDQYSVKMKRDVKGRRGTLQGKEARQLVKATRVEAVQSGSFFPIRRYTCLTMLGLLANVTGSLLISVQI